MSWTRTTAPLEEIRLDNRATAAFMFYAGMESDSDTDRFDHLYQVNQPYQRGSVWNVQQRVDLIRSLLLGLPIGEITLNERGTSTERNQQNFGSPHIYAIIDGKQRVETIRAFVSDGFAVPADWWEDDDIDAAQVSDDGKIRYSGLSRRGRLRVTMFKMPTSYARVRSLAAEAEIFRLLNSGGTPQTEESMANAARVEAGL